VNWVDNELKDAANRMNQAGLGNMVYQSTPTNASSTNVSDKKNRQAKDMKNQQDGDSLIAFLVGILAGILSIVIFIGGVVGKIDTISWGIASAILFFVEIISAKKAGKPIFQKFAWINLAGLVWILVLILKDKALYEWVNLQEGAYWDE